jgi:hypothetical protein
MSASVAFPAFALGHDATPRISPKNTRTTSAPRSRRPWYRALFPGTRIEQKDSETEIELIARGFRLATAGAGTALGQEPLRQSNTPHVREGIGQRQTVRIPSAPPAIRLEFAARPTLKSIAAICIGYRVAVPLRPRSLSNRPAVSLRENADPTSSRHQIGAPGFAWISRAKPSVTNLVPALLTAAPFIISGVAKQRSSRCAAALIISSCASVSLLLMIQPFLSSRRPGRIRTLTGTSPGSAEAEGTVGSPAHHARSVRRRHNARRGTKGQSFLRRERDCWFCASSSAKGGHLCWR